jgi:hypothetical protein
VTGIKRFDIPTSGRSPLEMYRAMRAFFEKVAESRGRKLDPAWYDDGPDKMPWLYTNSKEKPSNGNAT